MKNKERFKNFSFSYFSKGQLTAFLILAFLCFLMGSVMPILLSSNVLFSLKTEREYRVNELSDENLISPVSFSYIDEEATESKRRDAEKAVTPYFFYSYSASVRMREKAQMVYDYLVYGKAISDESLGQVSSILMKLTTPDDAAENAAVLRETVKFFYQMGIFDKEDVAYIISEGGRKIFVNSSSELPYTFSGLSVMVDNVMLEDNIVNYAYRWIVNNYPQLDSVEVQVLADIVGIIEEPNVFYDEVYTSSLREIARNSVEPVVVNITKGDYILRVDTIVTAEQLRTIDILNSKRISSTSPVTVVLQVIIVFSILALWFVYSVGLIQYEYRKAQYSIITLSLFLLSFVIGFLLVWKISNSGFTCFDSLMPFILVVLIGVSITNSVKYGVANILALAALFTLWPNASWFSIVYYVLSGIILANFIIKSNGRFDMIWTSIKCAGLLSVITLFFTLMTTTYLYNVLFAVSGCILNVSLSFVAYSIMLPTLEKLFNIPTKERLIELAYTDNAMLNQLSQVAQGTYSHVKNVADLAYSAAQAIGCNAELTLVGARYHDIGKIVHPEYFVENQAEKNAHDQISSQLSASVIKSHVRLGVEKGKSIGLPQEVLDIISEHHGNDIIRYFYNEAVKNMGEKSSIVREDFMYDGNPPTTKESAIVMLADCVEAATRTIKRPNHQKYEKFINTIVNDKIAHGQLDNSGLTMKDLKAIKEAFIPPLIGRDHHRISYDNEEKD